MHGQNHKKKKNQIFIQPMFSIGVYVQQPILVATWSEAWVCGSSLAGIVGLNPAGGMDAFLLCVVR